MFLISYLEKFPVIRDRLLPLIASQTRRRLARGAFRGGIAAVCTRVITVGSSFFLARILGMQGFGEYGIINNTAGMIGSMAGMGIGQTVTKYVAALKVSDPQRAGRILALSSLITWMSAGIYAAAFVALAPWLAEKTLAAPHLAPLLQISAITVALGVINSVQSCSLSGIESFKASSAVQIITGLLQSALVVLGAWRFGLKGAISALACGMIITVVMTRYVVQKEWRRYHLRLNWQGMGAEWRVLIHYSLPAFLILLTLGPVTWATNAFLTNQPHGYAELGVFNAALQWQVALQFLAGILCTAVIPVMSEKCGVGDIVASLRVMRGMIKSLMLLTIPLALGLCVLSPLIMRGYGASFAKGYWVMVMLVLAGAISAVLTPVASYITASGMMWAGFFINFGWVMAMLFGAWFLVRWGAEGLAGARLLASIIHGAVVLLVFPRLLSRPMVPR